MQAEINNINSPYSYEDKLSLKSLLDYSKFIQFSHSVDCKAGKLIYNCLTERQKLPVIDQQTSLFLQDSPQFLRDQFWSFCYISYTYTQNILTAKITCLETILI